MLQDGMIYKGDQMVVPLPLRADYLDHLHVNHMGFESTLLRACEVVHWPNMAEDIKRVTQECLVCEQDAPAQCNEKHTAQEVPNQPWGKVGVDLCHCKGKDYLIMVDYFFEIGELPCTLASAVIQTLKQHFAQHGVPLIVHSDGGPQFTTKLSRSLGGSLVQSRQHTTASQMEGRVGSKNHQETFQAES